MRGTAKEEDEIINNVHLRTPTYGHTSVDQQAKTYVHQLCVDTGYCLDDLAGAIDERHG